MKHRLSRALPIWTALMLASCQDFNLDPIPEEPSYLGLDLGNVAVVTGDFDRIEELLDALGIGYRLYDGFISGPPADAPLYSQYQEIKYPVEQLLGSKKELEAFDVLFINCGLRGTGEPDPATLETETYLLDSSDYARNLREFVEDGGALFVSDRSYTLLEAAIPELINFEGDDQEPGAAQVGEKANVTAEVDDEALQQTMSQSTVDIAFTASHWAMLSQSEDALLRADVLKYVTDIELALAPATPLLAEYPFGYGTVIFSSFHYQGQSNQALTDVQLFLLRELDN